MFLVKSLLLFVMMLSYQEFAFGQRSPYAGSRPGGYKDRFVPKQNDSATSNAIDSSGDIVNRFGAGNDGTQRPPMEGVAVVYGEQNPNLNVIPQQSRPTSLPNVQQTFDRLPYDAQGDVQLVNYLLSLPQDQWPFWLINWKQIEQHRNTTAPPSQNVNQVATRFSFFAR